MSDEETKLWYLRLGHMRERGMHELSKQDLLEERSLETLDFVNIVFIGSIRE